MTETHGVWTSKKQEGRGRSWPHPISEKNQEANCIYTSSVVNEQKTCLRVPRTCLSEDPYYFRVPEVQNVMFSKEVYKKEIIVSIHQELNVYELKEWRTYKRVMYL